jgi:hypothetical protein
VDGEGPDWFSQSCGNKIAVEDVGGGVMGLIRDWRSQSIGLQVDVENVGLRVRRPLVGRVKAEGSKQVAVQDKGGVGG